MKKVAPVIALVATLPLAVAGCSRPTGDLGVEDDVELTRLPPEYDPVEELLIGWDPELDNFFVELTMVASRHVAVTVAVGAHDDAERIGDLLEFYLPPDAPVRLLELPVDSVWVRDFGPLVVFDAHGARSIVDLTYPGTEPDDHFPETVARDVWGGRIQAAPVGLDGGNLLADGAGRCLTTTYALAPDRFSGTEGELRRYLHDLFGCRQLFILPELEREGTGHVDMYTMIPGPGRVLVGHYDAQVDSENAALLDRVAAELAQGGFEVTRIPMGDNYDGQFRTYTNALALNGALIVPIYLRSDRGQREALEILATAYPGREIVPIISDEMIELGGAVHCATSTLPATRSRP